MIAWSSAKRRSPWISTNPVNSRWMKSSSPGRFGWRATSTRCQGVSDSIQLGPNRLEPPPQRLDLAVARVGPRQRAQRLDLLEQDGDRLFEFERFGGIALISTTDVTFRDRARGNRDVIELTRADDLLDLGDRASATAGRESATRRRR